MILSRKLSAGAITGALATLAVWALAEYAHILVTPEQATAAVTALAAIVGWFVKEDARVAKHLDLRGQHRPTVADLVAKNEPTLAPAPQPRRPGSAVELTIPHGRLMAEYAREDRTD